MTNEMIAEKVFGWEKNKRWPWIWMIPDGPTSHNASQNKTPDFLNDHNAAMMVVEKMFEHGWCHQSGQNKEGVYWFEFWRDDVYEDHKVLNKSLCHAICEAALMAKGIDIESKD